MTARKESEAAGSDAILDRMMSLHPKIIDLKLDRVRRLLDAIERPERRLPPVIHVAGTNGKGSVVAMLRAGLEASGARVHVYTSPHLARFHERIRLAGELISEDLLAKTLDECERANGGEAITYFEITTCAALLAFARVPADWCLLEVGLGGRLDATNVVDRPALTAITPVSYDHQRHLGDTLTEIATEKAGILKPGVACVVAEQEAEARDAIEARAEAVCAPLLMQGRDWTTWEERGRMAFQDLNGLLDLPLPNLIGAHQVANAGVALAAMRALGLDDASAEAGIARAEWPARLQRLRRGPLVEAAGDCEVWLDGGHNPAAGTALAEAIGRLSPRPLRLVCGMLETKDVGGYVKPLALRARSLTAVGIPDAPASLPSDVIAAAARRSGLETDEAAGMEEAVARAASAHPGCRILICGSLHLAGAALRANG